MRIKFQHFKFIFLFLLIAFLVGIQNFFWAKFDISIFLDATFWSNTLNTSGIYYLTIILVVLWITEKRLATDPDILEDKSIIRNFVIKDLKPSFYVFNDEVSLENKTDAWKEKIKIKLDKLEQKATPLDRKAWREKDESNNYVLERLAIEELVSDQYIRENIEYLKVDYEKVDVTTIINGYSPKKSYKFKRENNIWKITKDTAPKFILSTIYTIFLTSFALTIKDFDMETVYKTIVTLAGLVLSAIWAVNYAPDFIQEQYVTPLTNAVLHIKNYFNWEKERGNQNETNNL